MEWAYRFAILGLFLTSVVLLGEAQCPAGWKNYRNSKCYLFSRQRVTWHQARRTCISYGADLVKINSREENNFLRGFRSGGWWIGMFLDPRVTVGNKFVWTDGASTTLLANWGPGEPSLRAGRAACVETHPWTGHWYKYHCRAKLRFICQKAANKCVINNGGCPHKCTYSKGESSCSCMDGYASFVGGTVCTALEDILTNGRIWQKKCQREFPTDTCLCGPGFKRSQYGNTWSCVDVDECQQNNGGCQHICLNTAGSYRCTCNDGFIVSQSSKTCKSLPSETSTPSTTSATTGTVAMTTNGTSTARSMNSTDELIANESAAQRGEAEKTEKPTTFPSVVKTTQSKFAPVQSKFHQSAGGSINCSSPPKEHLFLLRTVLILLAALFVLGVISFLYLVFSSSRMRRSWGQGCEYPNNFAETPESGAEKLPSKTADRVVNRLYGSVRKTYSPAAEDEKETKN